MDQASLDDVVLRLVEYEEDNDRNGAPGLVAASTRWWWVLDHEAFLTLDLIQPWHLQFYRLTDVTRTHGALRLHARKFWGAAWAVWRGVHQEAPALERTRLKDNQDERRRR